jgi:hypothetical protein
MPYEVHLQNREPPQPIRVAGSLVETRIVPETPALRVVDTKEDAQAVMREMIAQGVRPGDLYAVGYDWPI